MVIFESAKYDSEAMIAKTKVDTINEYFLYSSREGSPLIQGPAKIIYHFNTFPTVTLYS
jgi:hypothetical protein